MSLFSNCLQVSNCHCWSNTFLLIWTRLCVSYFVCVLLSVCWPTGSDHQTVKCVRQIFLTKMEFYHGVFLFGFFCLLCSRSSAQPLSYGQKLISLSRLSNYAEISQLLTSETQNGVANALDELVGNWERTLLWTARNGQHYSMSDYNVSSTCMKHLNLTFTHISQTWAQRSK